MNFQGPYQFFVPIKFINGYGSIERLGELSEGIGNHFMLVTGKNAMKSFGYTKKVLDILKARSKKSCPFCRSGTKSNYRYWDGVI
ncbi:MAG: hypothetical protein ACYCXK_00095 [Candidatus Humimicrobiaceae bacterium]